jgi:hypothetical protein
MALRTSILTERFSNPNSKLNSKFRRDDAQERNKIYKTKKRIPQQALRKLFMGKNLQCQINDSNEIITLANNERDPSTASIVT